MPDYSKGKIYRLVCNITGKQYIGSTISELYKRLDNHKRCFKCWKNGTKNYVSSYEIIGGNDYKIVLVENYPCGNKQELFARERYWIESVECVNLRNPLTTPEEVKNHRQEYNKIYRVEKKDQLEQMNKNYYINNREQILEKKQQYYFNNADKMRAVSKEYRDAKSSEIS